MTSLEEHVICAFTATGCSEMSQDSSFGWSQVAERVSDYEWLIEPNVTDEGDPEPLGLWPRNTPPQLKVTG